MSERYNANINTKSRESIRSLLERVAGHIPFYSMTAPYGNKEAGLRYMALTVLKDVKATLAQSFLSQYGQAGRFLAPNRVEHYASSSAIKLLLEADEFDFKRQAVKDKFDLLLMYGAHIRVTVINQQSKVAEEFLLAFPFVRGDSIDWPHISNGAIPVRYYYDKKTKNNKLIIDKSAAPSSVVSLTLGKFLSWLNGDLDDFGGNNQIEVKVESLLIGKGKTISKINKEDNPRELRDINNFLSDYESLVFKMHDHVAEFKKERQEVLSSEDSFSQKWDELHEGLKELLNNEALSFSRLRNLLKKELLMHRVYSTKKSRIRYLHILGKKIKVPQQSGEVKERLRAFLRKEQYKHLAKLMKVTDKHIEKHREISAALIWHLIVESGIHKVLSRWQLIKLAQIISIYIQRYRWVRSLFNRPDIDISGKAIEYNIFEELFDRPLTNKNKEALRSGISFADVVDTVGLYIKSRDAMGLVLSGGTSTEIDRPINFGGLAIGSINHASANIPPVFFLSLTGHSVTNKHERAHLMFGMLREVFREDILQNSENKDLDRSRHYYTRRFQNETCAHLMAELADITQEDLERRLEELFLEPFGLYDYYIQKELSEHTNLHGFAMDIRSFIDYSAKPSSSTVKIKEYLSRIGTRIGKVQDEADAKVNYKKFKYSPKDLHKVAKIYIKGVSDIIRDLEHALKHYQNEESLKDVLSRLVELKDKAQRALDLATGTDQGHKEYFKKTVRGWINFVLDLHKEYGDLTPYILMATPTQDLEYLLDK